MSTTIPTLMSDAVLELKALRDLVSFDPLIANAARPHLRALYDSLVEQEGQVKRGLDLRDAVELARGNVCPECAESLLAVLEGVEVPGGR